MMKFLYLIRHAQAEEYSKSGSDFNRVLTTKGEADAELIGIKLHDMDVNPQHLVTSPAARALQTAELICEELQQKKQDIKKDTRIYNASAADLLEVINEQDEQYKSIALLGHNPGFYEIANLLSDTEIHKFPKTGVIALAFAVSWKTIAPNTGMLQFFISPKQYI
jgi:phosphohistidine phosphatase